MKELIFAVFFIWNTAAVAGGEVGNGGDVVICLDSTGNKDYQFFDRYEAQLVYGLAPTNPGVIVEPAEIVKFWLKSIEDKLPRRSYAYSYFVSKFERQISFTDDSLIDIPDQGPIYLPGNCKLEQAIIQQWVTNPQLGIRHLVFGRYLVNRDIWNHLSPIDKAIAMLHEVVYRVKTEEQIRDPFFHDIETPDSTGSRRLNAALFTGRAKDLSLPKLNEFLLENGHRKLESEDGVVFLSQIPSTKFWEEGESGGLRGIKFSHSELFNSVTNYQGLGVPYVHNTAFRDSSTGDAISGNNGFIHCDSNLSPGLNGVKISQMNSPTSKEEGDVILNFYEYVSGKKEFRFVRSEADDPSEAVFKIDDPYNRRPFHAYAREVSLTEDGVEYLPNIRYSGSGGIEQVRVDGQIFRILAPYTITCDASLVKAYPEANVRFKTAKVNGLILGGGPYSNPIYFHKNPAGEMFDRKLKWFSFLGKYYYQGVWHDSNFNRVELELNEAGEVINVRK